MGSSKKHKDKDREHRRKHKHRSRSRSPHSRSRSKSKEKKHKERRHRDRDRDGEKKRKKSKPEVYDPYAEEVDYELEKIPVEIKQEPPETHGPAPPPPEPRAAASQATGEGAGTDLSIEETNKLRAKLGLKPLEVKTEKKEVAVIDGKQYKVVNVEGQDELHAPAQNLVEKRKTDELRRKMALIKEKREINKKLGKVKTLGESDSEEEGSALAWIKKQRKIQKERELAEKREKMLAEMDAEFGLEGVLEEEFGANKKKEYSSKDLRHMTVQHGQDQFKEGQTVILTLEDHGVLDEEKSDVLMNVNMLDDWKAEKNIEKKKKKPDYQPYDEPEYDEYGVLKPKDVLDKYDEEIHGEKKNYFTLGKGGKYDAGQDRAYEEIRKQMRAAGDTLTLAAPQLAAEYYTQDEMSFNKVKKKVRKIRKKPKAMRADDLVPLPGADNDADFGSRRRGRGRAREEEEENEEGGMEVDGVNGEAAAPIPGLDLVPQNMETEDLEETEILGPEEDLTGVVIEEDAAQLELQAALNKTRRLKQKKARSAAEKLAEDLVLQRNVAAMEAEEVAPVGIELPGSSIVLNSTSEFCRALGDIPTYGQAGNREEEKDELLEFEAELMEERKRKMEEDEDQPSGWNRVEIDDTPVDIKSEDAGVLDEEPVVCEGLGGALALAMRKGYLEKEVVRQRGAAPAQGMAIDNYTIEDKRYDDLDEKFKKRDRFSGGITMDFKEKDGYKPDVKLEYIDDSGRLLSQKEAFRYLSHRFHGKGSGKKKTEKRGKKIEEENLMKQMSSTDTPLGTVALLQEKQQAEKTPYIVLRGGNKTLTSNPIVK